LNYWYRKKRLQMHL